MNRQILLFFTLCSFCLYQESYGDLFTFNFGGEIESNTGGTVKTQNGIKLSSGNVNFHFTVDTEKLFDSDRQDHTAKYSRPFIGKAFFTIGDEVYHGNLDKEEGEIKIENKGRDKIEFTFKNFSGDDILKNNKFVSPKSVKLTFEDFFGIALDENPDASNFPKKMNLEDWTKKREFEIEFEEGAKLRGNLTEVTAVPEPGSIGLTVALFAAAALQMRRRKNHDKSKCNSIDGINE